MTKHVWRHEQNKDESILVHPPTFWKPNLPLEWMLFVWMILNGERQVRTCFLFIICLVCWSFLESILFFVLSFKNDNFLNMFIHTFTNLAINKTIACLSTRKMSFLFSFFTTKVIVCHIKLTWTLVPKFPSRYFYWISIKFVFVVQICVIFKFKLHMFIYLPRFTVGIWTLDILNYGTIRIADFGTPLFRSWLK